jgi:L-amino acid N-acyltransferase YncA
MTVRIRLVAPQDASAIAGIYRPIVESTPISFETEAPDEAEMRGRIEQTLRTYPWLVCEQDGCIAGYAYASRHHDRAAYQWSVDSSVYVQAGRRHSGVGRGLYTSLFRLLAAQGYFNVYAGITLPNPASVGLHESVGFERVGVYRSVGYKTGAWHDVGWWQLSLRSHDSSPPPVRTLAETRQDSAWTSMLAAGQPLVSRGGR